MTGASIVAKETLVSKNDSNTNADSRNIKTNNDQFYQVTVGQNNNNNSLKLQNSSGIGSENIFNKVVES